MQNGHSVSCRIHGVMLAVMFVELHVLVGAVFANFRCHLVCFIPDRSERSTWDPVAAGKVLVLLRRCLVEAALK